MKPHPLVLLIWNLCCLTLIFLSQYQVTILILTFLSLLVVTFYSPDKIRLWFFCSLIAAINSLWILATGWFYGYGEDALKQSLFVALRSWAVVSISCGFTFSMNLTHLIETLMQQFHLSPRWGFALQVAINLFPRLMNELQSIKHIHKIRNPYYFHFFARILTILVTALRLAQQSSLSMTLRGLEHSNNRTWLTSHPWKLSDTLLTTSGVLISLGIWITFF